MATRRITINVAGRVYPLTVPDEEEAMLRRVGKNIDVMIKNFESNFDIRDKQDALAMCALKLGTDAALSAQKMESEAKFSLEKLELLNRLLEDNGS